MLLLLLLLATFETCEFEYLLTRAGFTIRYVDVNLRRTAKKPVFSCEGIHLNRLEHVWIDPQMLCWKHPEAQSQIHMFSHQPNARYYHPRNKYHELPLPIIKLQNSQTISGNQRRRRKRSRLVRRISMGLYIQSHGQYISRQTMHEIGTRYRLLAKCTRRDWFALGRRRWYQGSMAERTIADGRTQEEVHNEYTFWE